MQPSAKQLIEGVAWSLDNRVAPVVDDKWAASTLRSVHCLLNHLAARVELEGPLLFEDNADARATLARVADLIGASPVIAGVLDRRWRDDGAYPDVTSLAAENEALREVIDGLLVSIPADTAVEEQQRTAAAAELAEYARRRLLRDQPMFMPAFLASVF